jgi:protocatechuate 3,4-dioxygenase beta subunit
MRRLSLIVILLTLVSVCASAGVRLSGTVWTENSVETVTLRVYAAGQAVVADPTRADTALLEVTAKPGQAFTLDVANGELPLRVEAGAKGHLGAVFMVLWPEQASLPPLWLPAGRELGVKLMLDGKPANGALLWGAIVTRVGGEEGRWRPAVLSQTADAKGQVSFALPREGSVYLATCTPEGRWSTHTLSQPWPAKLELAIGSRPLSVAVVNEKNEPVAGVLLAERSAPPRAAVRSNEQGKATIQVPSKGEIAVFALGQGLAGRFTYQTAPSKETVLRLTAARTQEVVWVGTSASIALEPMWVPAALRGGAPIVASGGKTRLPFFGSGGDVTLRRPGIAGQRVTSSSVAMPLAVRLAPAARVEGSVVDEANRPVGGVPVWAHVSPAMPAAMLRQMRAFLPTQKPLLPWAVSGPTGTIAIGDLAAGQQRVVARKIGLPPADSGPLEVAAGDVGKVTLQLAAGTWVALQVQDSASRAIAGATIEATPGERRDPNSPLALRIGRRGAVEAVASGSTDREGRARLLGVPVGPLKLELRAGGYVKRTLEIEVEAQGTDLGVVTLDEGVNVLGRVIDERGQGVGDAEVLASRQAEAGMFAEPLGRSGPTGDFVLADQPRTGELFLQARGEGVSSLAPTRVALPPEGVVDVRVRRGRTLEGKVVDEESQQPVAGASLGTRKMMQRGFGGGTTVLSTVRSFGQTTSDDAGVFRFEGVETGELTLSASAPGYRSVEINVTIPEDSAPRPVTVPLKKGLTLRGIVLDALGTPALGVDVRVEESGSDTRLPTLTNRSSLRTGPDGKFFADTLEPGRYQITAEDDTGASAREVAEAGQSEEITLRLQAEGVLAGSVVSEDGAPIAGATITAFGGTRGFTPTDTRSAPDGSFTIEHLAPGTFRVNGRAAGLAMASETVQVESGRTAQVKLTLKRGGTVAGTVRGLSADEQRSCQVRGGGQSAGLNAAGEFRLEGVRIGPVEVTALVLPAGRQRTARTELRSVDEPAHVEIDFASGLTIRGSVRKAGAPLVGTFVSASSPGERSMHSAVTDVDGRYEMKGLDPGTVTVEARADQGRLLASKTVDAQGDTTVDLEVASGALGGRVIDARSRNAVAGASVAVLAQGAPHGQAAADENGAFHFEDLADDAYTVRAEAAGYAAAEVEATVRLGHAAEVTVALQPSKGLTLLVRGVSGTPPSEISVRAARAGSVPISIGGVACDREGRAVVTDLGEGAYTLRVSEFFGQGQGLVAATVPGPDVLVTLSPSGIVEATLDGVATGVWRLRLISAAGLVLPQYSWGSALPDGWVTVPAGGYADRVPVGAYTLQYAGPDGAVRDMPVVVTPGGETAVTIGK